MILEDMPWPWDHSKKFLKSVNAILDQAIRTTTSGQGNSASKTNGHVPRQIDSRCRT